LELLLDDAAENTVLAIEVENLSDVARFRFSNCGFGIPNERLQQVLTSPDIPTSKAFQILREVRVRVEGWRGQLEISSDVGRGYSIVLQLRQFNLTSVLPAQTS
jgi:hypothetical protein